jgi:hypothetical protein
LLLFLLLLALVCAGIGSALGLFNRIYTPPALTAEKLAVYAEFIRIVQKHPDVGKVYLCSWGDHVPAEKFSPMELAALADLRAKLKKVGCTEAMMFGTIGGGPRYRFYSFERYPRLFSGPLVTPTAVYVVNPRDPNDVDDVCRGTGRSDLKHIKGCWYASGSFIGSRIYPQGFRIPKSIFDRSLDVPSNFDAESAMLENAVEQGEPLPTHP